MIMRNDNITNEQPKEKILYTVKVLKVTSVTEKKIRFNLDVNGVQIYGMQYIEYVNKEGQPGSMIAFPSYKGNNDQFYNNCWFPVSAEVKTDIENQLQALINQ